MKIGPKYKIARRLGVPIFEKTQTPKYILSLSRKEKNSRLIRGKSKSEFGRQLIEKQKVRFSYGIVEKQFRNYVIRALRAPNPVLELFTTLEYRLDNVVSRSGLTKTRAQARQAVSHGHITVNGRRVTIASMRVSEGDIIELSVSSINSRLFEEVTERMKSIVTSSWIKVDPTKKQVVIVGQPVYEKENHPFDLEMVVEFYSR